MSKVILVNYLKHIGHIDFDGKTHILYNSDEDIFALKYGAMTLGIYNCKIDNKYISVKLDKKQSIMKPIRNPINPLIEKMWQYRFFQKHRARTMEEYLELVNKARSGDNESRIQYLEVCEEKYHICVKVDTKYDIMIPVAFYINMSENVSLNELDTDLETLFHRYNPRNIEIFY